MFDYAKLGDLLFQNMPSLNKLPKKKPLFKKKRGSEYFD